MTENKNVLTVLNGFLGLTTTEKMAFSRELEQFIREGVIISDYTNGVVKNRIQAQLSANLGPMSNNNCKCCGKG